MTLRKIDKDTVGISSTTEETVSIPKLKAKLDTMMAQKEIYDAAVAYKATMPEDMQPFFAEPPSMTEEEIKEMEEKITSYEKL